MSCLQAVVLCICDLTTAVNWVLFSAWVNAAELLSCCRDPSLQKKSCIESCLSSPYLITATAVYISLFRFNHTFSENMPFIMVVKTAKWMLTRSYLSFLSNQLIFVNWVFCSVDYFITCNFFLQPGECWWQIAMKWKNVPTIENSKIIGNNGICRLWRL